MLGYRQGNLKGIPTGGVVLTGSGLALAKSMAVFKSGIASSGKALEEMVMKLPNLQTGKVINPHIDLNDLSKSLPKGYEFISASEVKGPKGGIYHLIGRDADGNPIYFNNKNFLSFEDGLKKELKSDPGLVRTLAMDDYGTKYKWLLDEKAKNINEKLGFRGEVKQYTGNDYFKSGVDWQASQNGTGLMYRVYQQDIDSSLKPFSKYGDLNTTNAELMREGKAPYILKDGKLQQVQLHHSRQDGRGSLFEITKNTHLSINKNNGAEALHPYGSSQHPSYPVERSLFGKDRSQYWIDRINNLERGN